jgi:DNA-binding response OmpR family regulator
LSLVYVADDEPTLRELVSDELSDAGFEVRAFASGAELLAAAQARRPDAVLVDINMPGLTGWDVRRWLDAHDAGIPVVAVTAQVGPMVEDLALRTLHFSAFLRKPFAMADLVATVERACRAATVTRA